MLTALLLALIGSADLLRSALRRPAAALLITVAWLGLGAVWVTGLGIHPGWVVVPVALGVGWVVTTSIDSRAASGVLPAIGLAIAVVALLVTDRTAIGVDGYLVDWHAEVASAALRAVPLPALLLGLGAGLFLVESANIIVRASLRPGATASDAAARPPRRSRFRRPRTEAEPIVADLRGGRLIGPVERLLIVALALAGAHPVVAGLVAAKGIVRFPEISKDGVGGSKAEYFLVGSLVSWGTAGAATALLWIAGQG